MDDRTNTRRRGIRMALQVATITLGAGALAAAAASEARAATSAGEGGPDVASVEQVTSHGWSCWGGPVSRGPLAPPVQDPCDAERLFAELAS